MKCEGCQKSTRGYDLFDYCEHCSKNLCEQCMTTGRCLDASDHKHCPAEQGEEDNNGPGPDSKH